MLRVLFSKHTAPLLAISLLLIVSLACNAVSSGTSTAQPSSNSNQQATPAETASQNITTEQDVTYGPGPLELVDTKIGLSDLSSYTAKIVITFDGTQDGNTAKWSKSYTMLAVNKPQARQWTIEK